MSSPHAPPLRVVIDNSVLVAILRHREPGNNWLIWLWRTGRIVPLASQETIDELKRVLLRDSPVMGHYQATKFVTAAVYRYEPWCELVEPQDSSLNPKCVDEDDQKFVDLALEGEADVLIARDGRLLDMGGRLPFEVIEDQEFRDRMGAG